MNLTCLMFILSPNIFGNYINLQGPVNQLFFTKLGRNSPGNSSETLLEILNRASIPCSLLTVFNFHPYKWTFPLIQAILVSYKSS